MHGTLLTRQALKWELSFKWFPLCSRFDCLNAFVMTNSKSFQANPRRSIRCIAMQRHCLNLTHVRWLSWKRFSSFGVWISVWLNNGSEELSRCFSKMENANGAKESNSREWKRERERILGLDNGKSNEMKGNERKEKERKIEREGKRREKGRLHYKQNRKSNQGKTGWEKIDSPC